MNTTKKTALLIGATGLTGGKILQLLLDDDRYAKVKLFSRSSVGFTHKKLEEHLVDLFDINIYASDFTGDEVYCCIGTTKKKTPDNDTYKKIDYGIPVSIAKLAHENAISTFIVISALGASSSSSVFYNRIKGEMEDDVLKQKLDRTFILQPSLIGGDRSEKRTGEWLFKQFMMVLGVVMVGPLKKYKTIEPIVIAKAMIWLANNEYPSIKIESDKIKEIVD